MDKKRYFFLIIENRVDGQDKELWRGERFFDTSWEAGEKRACVEYMKIIGRALADDFSHGLVYTLHDTDARYIKLYRMDARWYDKPVYELPNGALDLYKLVKIG